MRNILLIALLMLSATLVSAQCPEVNRTQDGKSLLIFYPEGVVALSYDEEGKAVTEVVREYFYGQYSYGAFSTAKGERLAFVVERTFWDPVTNQLVTVAGPIFPVIFNDHELYVERVFSEGGDDLVFILDQEAGELTGGEASRGGLLLELYRVDGKILYAKRCLDDGDLEYSDSELKSSFDDFAKQFYGASSEIDGYTVRHVVCWNDFRALLFNYPTCSYTGNNNGEPIVYPPLEGSDEGDITDDIDDELPELPGDDDDNSNTDARVELTLRYKKKTLSITPTGFSKGENCIAQMYAETKKKSFYVGIRRNVVSGEPITFERVPKRKRKKATIDIRFRVRCENIALPMEATVRAPIKASKRRGKGTKAIVRAMKKSF